MTTVAAIDCGTNSIRLLISADGPEGPTDVVRTMRIVRLGEGIDTTGRISAAALERTGEALSEYAEVIEKHAPRAVRMVATSASRDATNADAFTDLVMARLGITPEVITGDEEARLSFGGAVADLPDDGRVRLVVDIGGGSTEFVRGVRRADAAHSVDIGCVRMTERHLHSDPPTAEQIAAAEADIIAHVDTALAIADPRRSAETLVGLAGSVTTVTALALGLDSYRPERIHHAEIGYELVAEVTDRLLRQTRAERLESDVMHPGRADVIGAGALVLRIIMERAGLDRVTASEHDILDGIAASIR
ncbi:exopolyphosphatase/guanosine-5'-triphosphate,3'-diphosphate pyrophosphatase [Stackebrandtia albiflava]|uniref:Exopolyphosphatase/guanosine-5'-triphosphate, 3'-diphosphate pyrophosphatase n=1 Tax=Stackebrandtia albiflava TaxID=406432 RepID=A0A562V307_9ACTN|nr:Ppx/GppA phosphatase family protein [Stackebrandtia albiflava]TWJ12251.1 exopolyphosphatase/guanosine-5'-triphosphate,3'-diphosphate pyrophosphatase [Stackebrandtia albiflava]